MKTLKKFICILLSFLLIILCSATAFAERSEVPAINGMGDLDNNGRCTVKDLYYLNMYMCKRLLLSTDQEKSSDMNGDGVIDIKDVTLLQKTILIFDIPVTSIVLDKESITMGVGSSMVLNAHAVPDSATNTTLNFSSNNTEVATVDTDGKISAVGIGTAVIKVSDSTGNVSAECIVKAVSAAVSAISLEKSDIYLYTGSSYQIKATVIPADALDTTLTYSSSNSNFTVSSTGLVTAVAEGTATITVKSKNGVSAQCTVSGFKKIVDYNTIYNSAEVKRDCSILSQVYPDLIKYSSIGTSVKNDSIPMITIGKGSRKVCVTAGIHSREILTSSFTMRCVEEYAKAYYSASQKYNGYNIKNLLDAITIYVVPACNPDGMNIYSQGLDVNYSYPNLSSQRLDFKGNANGVNLNRNFPFYWNEITTGGVSTRTNTEQRYKGPSVGSEPETQALMNLCNSNNFEWMFSMHLRGGCIYWADEKNIITSTSRSLANTLASKCDLYTMPTSTDPNGYGGGYENWFRYKSGKPGFCIELVHEYVTTPWYPSYYNDIFETATDWDDTKTLFLAGLNYIY